MLKKDLEVIRYGGKKYAEIAIIVEKDEKSIDNALQRIKKKISKIVAERQ